MSCGILSHRKQGFTVVGSTNEIHLLGIPRARQVRKHVGERAQHRAGRVFQLQRRAAHERTFTRRGSSSARQHGRDRELEERKSCRDRWSIHGNEGATGWNPGAGSARSESRYSAHFPISWSEVELWINRDTPGGGCKRTDQRERAATAHECLAMRMPAQRNLSGAFKKS